MWRLMLAAVTLLAAGDAALAQWGQPYGYDGRSPYYAPYGRSPYYAPYGRAPAFQRPPPRDGFFSPWGWDDDPRWRMRPPGPKFQSGGARPDIAPVEPKRIAFPSTFPVDSIVIDHKGRQLLFVTSATEALHYPISVGREGFSWSGTEKISRVANWPDWHPPDEMRDRDPGLPERMSGGIRNPLGAKALYLGNSLYRIHGTNDPRSIGKAASSGCFRMLNGHVVDLASRIQIGTVVTVVNRLPADLDRLVAEQVRPPRERERLGARTDGY
jgi:lipoprotein-anchoring transpeptidase ErfK/SrfK